MDLQKFDNRVGALGVEVTALADDATATITIKDYLTTSFVAASEDADGVIAGPSATTFSVAINRTTGVITFTNLSSVAFTGTYYIFGIA